MRIVWVLALVFLATPWERASRFLQEGNLAEAEREYRALLSEHPADPEAHYNLGTVLLLAGRPDEARPHLETAAASAEALRAVASYNLGNTDLQPAYERADLPERDARLRRAVEAYKQSLLVDPDDEDAKWNLELARRLLERDPPPQVGGGAGGGGGEGPPQPGAAQPAPTPAGDQGPEPETAETEAEELLRAAHERELEVQRTRLRRPQPPGPIRP
jgi:tetratricopeptide (TPR) repeat protein